MGGGSGGGGRGGRSGGGGGESYAELDAQFEDIVQQRRELARSEPPKYSKEKWEEWNAKDDALLKKQMAIKAKRDAAFKGSAQETAQKERLKAFDREAKQRASKLTREDRMRALDASYEHDVMEGGKEFLNRSVYSPLGYKPYRKKRK